MWFENNEENIHLKKTDIHSRNEWKSKLKSNKNIREIQSSSSDEESKRSE